MQRLTATIGFHLSLTLFLCLSLCRPSFADAPSIVINGSGPGAMLVGQSQDCSFDAVVNNEPQTNQEATITGPTWTWSATVSGGPNGDSSGSSATVYSPPPPQQQGASTTVTLSFSKLGTYHVTVTANAQYTTSSSSDPINVSGNTSFDVVVGDITVSITQSSASTNQANVGDPVKITLNVKLNVPNGVTVSSGPTWDWDFGDEVQYRATSNDAWDSTNAPGYDLTIEWNPGEPNAEYTAIFDSPGQYLIKVKATATFTVNGTKLTRSDSAYVH